MGVASGQLLPTPAYNSIQRHCIEHRERWVSIPGLTVSVVGGVPIECSGGVQITDFSPELGEAGIEVHIQGVPTRATGNSFHITWKLTRNNLDREHGYFGHCLVSYLTCKVPFGRFSGNRLPGTSLCSPAASNFRGSDPAGGRPQFHPMRPCHRRQIVAHLFLHW